MIDGSKPLIYFAVDTRSINAIEILLDTEKVNTNFIYDNNTLLSFAVNTDYHYNDYKRLLEEEIDWSYKISRYGTMKTFLEILSTEEVDKIKAVFPLKYEKYEVINNFNI